MMTIYRSNAEAECRGDGCSALFTSHGSKQPIAAVHHRPVIDQLLNLNQACQVPGHGLACQLHSPCASSGMASSAILLVREPARLALRGDGVATGLRAAEALADLLLACEILHKRQVPLSK